MSLFALSERMEAAPKAVPVRTYGQLTRAFGLLMEGRGLSCNVGDVVEVIGAGGRAVPAEVVGFRDDRMGSSSALMPSWSTGPPDSRAIRPPDSSAGSAARSSVDGSHPSVSDWRSCSMNSYLSWTGMLSITKSADSCAVLTVTVTEYTLIRIRGIQAGEYGLIRTSTTT